MHYKNEDDLLQLIASLNQYSEHPLRNGLILPKQKI
jgi:cation transport ATPase